MDEGGAISFISRMPSTACGRAGRAGASPRCPRRALVHFRGGSGPVKALQKAKKRMPGYFYASRSRFSFTRPMAGPA